MSKSVNLNIALIGLGAIAQKAYLPILANHAQVTPILCTRNNGMLHRLAQQYRIEKVYNNLDDLLKIELDAAMVHSATESHFPIVSKLIKAGIPVFVDKPLSYSFQKAEELLNLAAQKQSLLYLGFNRRFAPLIQSLATSRDPIQITWQKNRVNLPGDPRVFIFGDFIHVVDSLRFLGRGGVVDLHVYSRMRKGLLESANVQWQQNNTLLSGTMNRVSGITEERVDYFAPGHTWSLDGLDSGWHYKDGKKMPLEFDPWETTLYKRGFTAMVEDWLNVLQHDKFDDNRLKDIWETHHLCERILGQV